MLWGLRWGRAASALVGALLQQLVDEAEVLRSWVDTSVRSTISTVSGP